LVLSAGLIIPIPTMCGAVDGECYWKELLIFQRDNHAYDSRELSMLRSAIWSMVAIW